MKPCIDHTPYTTVYTVAVCLPVPYQIAVCNGLHSLEGIKELREVLAKGNDLLQEPHGVEVAHC